jgi:hypothetical protein
MCLWNYNQNSRRRKIQFALARRLEQSYLLVASLVAVHIHVCGMPLDQATLVNDTLVGHRNFGNPLLEPRSHRHADGNRYEN